ncbi:ATP-binding protein [Parabacteroides goldsteinii]|uniref:ATP-binding protein n=1 Tax=Parabacteroides goldsteinii TaxID=328812 RepID=UPI0026731DB8|nr:ATP-binding protein [Parabacteroides goldsteinii]
MTSFHSMASQNEGENKYVLIINSYTESTPWSRIFTAPIYEQMAIGNEKWTVYTENMDVMLMKTEADVENFITYLSQKYTEAPPSLVILLGNSSYALLRDELKHRWGKDIPFLVCAENDFIAPREYYLSKEACPEDLQVKFSEMVKTFHNLTILHVPGYISETIALMKKLKPDMNRLVFLADKRYVSAQNKSFVQQVMESDFPDVKLELITAGETSTDKLITILGNVDKRTCILYYSWILLNQQGNRTIISSDTYRMLSSYTDVPIFTLNDMDIVENGMVGGFFYPAANISSMLVTAVTNILKGERMHAIITPGRPCPVLNYPILEQKHIPDSDLSSGTLLYMKPPTFWEQYHTHVFAGSGGLFVFIAFLCFRIKSLNRQRTFQAKEIAFMKNYSRLINSMPISYMKQRILYKEGKATDYMIIEVNPEFEHLFDKKEVFINKKGSELSHSRLTQYMQTCSFVLMQNKKISVQYYHEPSDRYLNVLIISSCTSDCIDIFMSDVTEVVKTQQVLRTVNKKLSMSLNVANVIPWKWDLVRQTILCDVNTAVSASFSGLFDENQLTVPADQYFAKIYKEDRGKVEKAYEALIQGHVDKVKEEYRIYHPEKGVHELEWVETYATIEKRDDDGKPIALIGSLMTITDRKKAESELMEAKNKAEESNRLKSAFLANMSHEIRTPLNAIVGFSNILAMADDVDEKEEYVQIIENNNTLLLQLINDILDLSKIEAGTLDFVYSDANINGILRELEMSMQSRITNNVKLIFEQKQGECFVSIVKNRFMQVIINLITNAIKFTEEGSIRFGYFIQSNNMLSIYVADTGCGIPPEKQKSIFERFVKLNAFAQGTGLGLSICRMIVEHLGGEMWLESEEGKGTTFWFTFPYEPAVMQEREEGNFEKKRIEKENLKVLIAEDNAGNFKLFESILKQDYTIVHAWNGKEAIELFRKHRPHIILMDINMPEMNGYEATEEIRKISPEVPIIAVTAYAFASDEDRIMNSGFDAYASKPLNAQVLKRQMGDLLKKRVLLI